jgi:NADH dehydrogenase
MTEPRSRICLLGGGFGGLYTALRLSQLPWEPTSAPEITLIDRQDRFLFAPFLYELISDEMQTWEIAPPFAELLVGTPIKFVQGEVTRIDIPQKQVELQDAPAMAYDYLVIALGGQTPVPSIPGIKDYALGFRTLEDAYRVKEKLRQLEQSPAEKIRVAVVGGGYSGVELACKLRDRLGERGRIRLIERNSTILSTSPESNRQAAQATLAEKGIWLDLETEVGQLEAQALTLCYKGQADTIPVDLVLWTVGSQVSELIQALPLPHSHQGRLSTNTCLQVMDFPHLFALGDAADGRDATGQSVPATAQAAFQQADYCAWNLWALITQRPLLPFRYQALGEMLSLGTNTAALSGLGLHLSGPAAVLARRLVYLYRFPTWQHQLTVGLNWLTQPLLKLLQT